MASYDPDPPEFQGATSGAVWLLLGGVGLAVGEAAYQADSATNHMVWGWLAGAGVFAVVVAGLLWRSRQRVVASALLVLAISLGIGGWRLRETGTAPERLAATAVREARQDRDRNLAVALATARRVGQNALNRVGNAPPGSAPSLRDLIGGAPVELGVVVLGGDTVIAVAGPQRTGTEPSHSELVLRQGPFATVLVVTTTRGARRAQVNLLLDGSPALPSRGKSLAETSGSWHRVGWRWPDNRDEIRLSDTDDATRVIGEAMIPVAPEPGALRERERVLSTRLAVGGLLLVAVVIIGAGAPPLLRVATAVMAVWVVARSGVIPDASGGAATYALLSGAALLVASVVLWRRPARRVPIGVMAAIILLAVAQPLVTRAAHEIAPPVVPWSLLTWFGWEAVLAVATAGYLALASAPLRSREDALASPTWGWLATLAAVLIGGLGIETWSPEHVAGWPVWYLGCWLVPMALLLPVTRPFARRIALATVAAVVAALAAWHATLSARMTEARADLRQLAAYTDSATTEALDRFGDRVVAEGATRLRDVYALWRESDLGNNEVTTRHERRDSAITGVSPSITVPTQLAIWVDTTVVEWLAMHQMQVTWPDLQRLVEDDPGTRRHVSFARDPGRHDVLVLPMDGDTTITMLAGPRSRLIPPTRFGRLTQPEGVSEAPYTLQVVSAEQARPDLTFRRSGRHVRADHAVDAGGRPLVVRATVAMQPPRPFVVRAALTVLLDVLLILLLWEVVERVLVAGPRGETAVFRRSHRRTLIAALISFFVVPAGFFTLWSALRLRQDVARERGDEVTRALEAIGSDPAMATDSLSLARPLTLAQVADRVDAEVGVYRGGRLTAASTPLLAEMGLLSPVLDPALPRNDLAEAGRLATPVPGANVRIGGITVPPGNTAIVAALPGADAELERDQIDLALLLLLSSLGGMIAALVVAGAVARALNQPIEALRQRALAIGRRELPPPHRAAPAEFESVFSALSQMERDLVESETRLEEETARTARIVAWGEMARQVAHEIKNPLTPMRLGLQHLKRLGADGRADLAQQAESTADRLLGEIDRLDRIARSFARYGAPPEREAGPLEAVALGDVIREISQLYSLASAQLRVTVQGDAPPVVARREEVIQVVLNLVDNARAAGAEEVWLELAPGVLTVRDDGRGIPADQLERIFEPTFSTTSSGTGLGLAIARRLVEGWGARIEATSRPGDGATFRITWGPDSTATVAPA